MTLNQYLKRITKLAKTHGNNKVLYGDHHEDFLVCPNEIEISYLRIFPNKRPNWDSHIRLWESDMPENQKGEEVVII